ncbi:MAG: YcxB family protein [Lachnospiraceae bacterium]
MNTLEFDIKISSADLFNYMMRHIYCGMQGILSTVLGVFALYIFATTNQVIYLIAGVVIILYLPWSLFLKSKQQVLHNPTFKNSIHYTFDGEGLTVRQGESLEFQAWEHMYKLVATRRSVILYTNPIHASIFPRKQLGDQQEAVISYLKEVIQSNRIKMRK